MKDHRARSMGDTASAVGSMLLFVLFAVCMLMAVAVAADTYSRIKTGYQQSFGTAASSLEFSEHDGLYEITVGSGSSSSVILVRKG